MSVLPKQAVHLESQASKSINLTWLTGLSAGLIPLIIIAVDLIITDEGFAPWKLVIFDFPNIAVIKFFRKLNLIEVSS